ncbi:MAG: hypothetical protein M3R47_17900, partial [Chloroflexota bacterium]|nr:hypothetical protein [Chloroflexota bacterium]
MKTSAQNTPLVCNMDVFTPAERENHIRTTTQLFQYVQTIHEVENGFEFMFPNSGAAENITQLAEFIFNERRCCPFLEFTLRIAPNDTPISLLLTGPEGTQEFLRAEFTEYRSSGN